MSSLHLGVEADVDDWVVDAGGLCEYSGGGVGGGVDVDGGAEAHHEGEGGVRQPGHQEGRHHHGHHGGHAALSPGRGERLRGRLRTRLSPLLGHHLDVKMPGLMSV